MKDNRAIFWMSVTLGAIRLTYDFWRSIYRWATTKEE